MRCWSIRRENAEGRTTPARTMPVDECIALGLTLTSALEHFHKNGLVHRDIKPSNIIFVR